MELRKSEKIIIAIAILLLCGITSWYVLSSGYAVLEVLEAAEEEWFGPRP